MHIADFDFGMLGANGIVAGGISIITGAGLAAQMEGKGGVAVSFFGDGASNAGPFHECLNIAATWKLPMLYVCENNLYAAQTSAAATHALPDVAARAAGYGIPGIVVDGNDIVAVHQAAIRAVERARSGGGPTLIECKTYRQRAHTERKGQPDSRDKAEMAAQTDELVRGLRALDSRLRAGPDRPFVLLEYAAGLPPEWFAGVAEQVADLARISFCIDTGHVGIKQARDHLARTEPGGNLGALRLGDPRLPELAGTVQSAVATALPTVLELIGRLGAIGKPVHFHLHDGHPLIAGLPDHFSFLTQLPIPFTYQHRRSLAPLYGPAGLASIVTAAVEVCSVGRASLTLEIHQAEGRLPLGDAAGLFRHWRDTTNAERMNYWQAVLAENHLLVHAALEQVRRSAPVHVTGEVAT